MGHNYGKHFNPNHPNNNRPFGMDQRVSNVDNVNELPSEDHNVVESVVENKEETVMTVQYVDGVVSGCDKLNVRSESNKESNVLCVIAKDSVVKVDLTEDDSANEFYKVVTPSGVEGYCMKKFITIR